MVLAQIANLGFSNLIFVAAWGGVLLLCRFVYLYLYDRMNLFYLTRYRLRRVRKTRRRIRLFPFKVRRGLTITHKRTKQLARAGLRERERMTVSHRPAFHRH